METKLNKYEKEGWIFIGEIEFKYNPFSKYKDEEPVFMYACSHMNEENTKVYYMYGFGRGINTVIYLSYFQLEKRYSITTILQYYISHDMICNGVEGRYELPANKQACRLAGMQEWIYPNEKFLNKEIELSNLEKLWRTDKEEKIIEEFMHNDYASDESKQNCRKNGYYKI